MNALDNLIAWRAVMIAAQTGSLTETAERLGMELSKVSRLVTNFEREMGFQFLIRQRVPIDQPQNYAHWLMPRNLT